VSSPTASAPHRLRELLGLEAALHVPGAFDVFSARIIEDVGFDAVYLGGAAAGASSLGLPDHSLITMTELLDQARRVTSSVDVPVIADLDDGGGTALNVRRFVRLAERAGLAAVHIEDVVPGKHFTGHPDSLLPARTFNDRIRAAVDARIENDFVIIARSDSTTIEEIVERVTTSVEAGADLVFLPRLRRRDVPRLHEATDAPMVQIGYPGLDPLETGAKIVIYPVDALFASLSAVRQTMLALRTGDYSSVDASSMEEFNRLVGVPEATELAEKYGMVERARPNL
jgi:2,3-dimethylmalate lyase